MALLEAREVRKIYRAGTRGEVRALDGVSISIDRGTFVALTGPSGSGKTTLLALLGALDRPTAGQLLFDGSDLSRASDFALARLRRRAGFVFQDFALIPTLNVWENATYPLIPRGVGQQARLAIAERLLKRLGIPDKLTARPDELSGGEQQRVALARALAGDPEVLFADEPTSNLDAGTANDTLEILQEFHQSGGTVVVSTHDPKLSGIAKEIRELKGGRMVEG